jgi:hypothetical protein
MDFLNGIGGYMNPAQVLNALAPDGSGGSLLSFGGDGSIDSRSVEKIPGRTRSAAMNLATPRLERAATNLNRTTGRSNPPDFDSTRCLLRLRPVEMAAGWRTIGLERLS